MDQALQILVIEDDQTLKPVVTAIIRKIRPEARIEWRTSVDQVLIEKRMNWRSLRAYDMIIADVYLPGAYTGLELWHRCRFNCPFVSFLIISGMTPKQNEEQMSIHGTLPNFLAKPFDADTCTKVITGLLG
jgi:response regulator of citrate/malate metabolism